MTNIVDINKYKKEKVEESIKEQSDELTKAVRSLNEYEFIKFAAHSYSEMEKQIDKRHALLFLSQLFNARMLYIEDLIFEEVENEKK